MVAAMLLLVLLCGFTLLVAVLCGWVVRRGDCIRLGEDAQKLDREAEHIAKHLVRLLQSLTCDPPSPVLLGL